MTGILALQTAALLAGSAILILLLVPPARMTATPVPMMFAIPGDHAPIR